MNAAHSSLGFKTAEGYREPVLNKTSMKELNGAIVGLCEHGESNIEKAVLEVAHILWKIKWKNGMGENRELDQRRSFLSAKLGSLKVGICNSITGEEMSIYILMIHHA